MFLETFYLCLRYGLGPGIEGLAEERDIAVEK